MATPVFSRQSDDLTVTPLLRDAAFNRKTVQDGNHVSPFDNARIDIGLDNIEVRLVQGINEEDFASVLGRGVQATTGIDPANPPEEMPWQEVLKGGLQMGLETQVVVFEVAGVTRTCTHQLVRTRKAAFHQQSQRATFMGEFPDVRMPESIWRDVYAREAFVRSVEAAWASYRTAVQADISYQDARFILPEATQTYILLEYPLRTFLETYAYRGCTMFQWEHVHVMREARRLLVERHPWLEPHIKISCEKQKRCTFMGWESVEEQCDFPWAKEENRVYQPDRKLRIG